MALQQLAPIIIAMIPLGCAARLLAGLRLGRRLAIDAPECTALSLPTTVLHLLKMAPYTAVAMPETSAKDTEQPTPPRSRSKRKQPSPAPDATSPVPDAAPRQRRSRRKQPSPTPDAVSPAPDAAPCQRRTVILEDDQQAWNKIIIPRAIWPVLMMLRAEGA